MTTTTRSASPRKTTASKTDTCRASTSNFTGTSTVTDRNDRPFTDDEAWFEFAGGPESFTLAMHKTRFAAGMPASRCGPDGPSHDLTGDKSPAFDVAELVLEALRANETGGGSSYQPVERYRITDLERAHRRRDVRVALHLRRHLPGGLRRPSDPQKKRSLNEQHTHDNETRIQTVRRRAHRARHQGRHRRRRPHVALVHPRRRAGPHAPAVQKEEVRIAGIEIAEIVLTTGSTPEMRFEQVLRDGDRVRPGDVAFYVSRPPALAAAGRAHPAQHHAAHERRGDADRRIRPPARRPVPACSTRARPRRACACWTRWP